MAMKKWYQLLLSIIFLLLLEIVDGQNLSISPENDKQIALVFELINRRANKTIYCSATLLNIEGRCELFTNAHCGTLGERVEIKTALSSTKQSLLNQHTVKETIVKVVKHDKVLDIAQLSQDNLTSYCDQLITIIIDNDDEEASSLAGNTFATKGIAKHSIVYRYSEGIKWSDSFGISHLVSKYYLNHEAFFLSFSDLEIVPGMSGGPVFSLNQKLLGLNAQFIPFQDVTLVVPLPLIKKFINSQSANKTTDPQTPFHVASHVIMANNSFLPGGENEHMRGEDNGNPSLKGLIGTRAAPEGIEMHNDSHKTFLGFTTTTDHLFKTTIYHQIDGTNDYQLKFKKSDYPPNESSKLKSKKMISRDKDGYPPKEIRETLFNRLDGFYRGHKKYNDSNSDEAKTLFLNEKHSHFIKDNENPRGWVKQFNGFSFATIDINHKRSLIAITIHPHDLLPTFESHFIPIRFSEVSYVFKIHFKDKSRTIELIHEKSGDVLSCDNKNLLKLICYNDMAEFSFSIDNTTKDRVGKYRFAFYNSPLHLDQFDYFFGTIGAVPNQKEWRNK